MEGLWDAAPQGMIGRGIDSQRGRRRDPVANEGVSLGRTNVDDDGCSVRSAFNKG